MREDAHGLKVEGKLTLEVEKAREAHALMKDGALGLSIGFRVPAGGASFGKSGDRVLTEVDLAEVSVVALPANTNARITGVKSIRDFESVLRDELGFSAREARRLASGGWRALEERDSLQFGAEDLLRAIAAKTNELDSLLRK
jgi:phage head maturation protease